MDIVTTSLEALLQRATNPQNENVDKAAVEAFCALVNKENEGCHIGVRILANRIHAQNEREALQTLGVLDTCMKKCGVAFQSEVGKFRFLNEMIKLVSPKYLGSQTPVSVRVKVLQLLQAWTEDYPKETKIKEAYDMLRKQGVIVEFSQVQKIAENAARNAKTANSIFDNDERSRLLQKLLQSKNPDDLHAANRLIKTMVKEDDKRAELVSKRTTELESVHNNVRLLNEMLDSYRPGFSSADELDLIKELHQSCERLRPNVIRLAAETQQNEDMLKEVLQANDELGQVFDKFTATIVKGIVCARKSTDSDSLLDLGSPGEPLAPCLLEDVVLSGLDGKKEEPAKPESDIDALCDIFSSPALPTNLSLPETLILKPTAVQQASLAGLSALGADTDKSSTKLRAFEDLDVLGESLLKENLPANASRLAAGFNKSAEKIPMNQLPRQPQESQEKNSSRPSGAPPSMPATDAASGLDLSFLAGKPDGSGARPAAEALNGDDCMVDISDEQADAKLCLALEQPGPRPAGQPAEVRPLTDVFVRLDSIKPSAVPPITVLEEKNGVSVTLHFARDRPRDDVQVIVVTTISKNSCALVDYLFQAVVPKTCKLKLQPPSGCDLPAHNPFLPPAAITQIMLVANPGQVRVPLKFMMSYTLDGELCTEMGEIDSLPPLSH